MPKMYTDMITACILTPSKPNPYICTSPNTTIMYIIYILQGQQSEAEFKY